MLTKIKTVPLLLSFLFLMQACAPTLPMTKKNTMTLPQSYPEGKDEGDNDGVDLANQNWQQFFKDQKLISLIDVALKNNQELKLIEQEINISNNEIMARQGEYLPKLGFKADGGLAKTERFSTEDANKETTFGRAGLTASWEVDIWKKLRNATKSAYLEYLASIEGRRYAVTSLVSEVANTYFELMALDNQLEIVNSYVKVLTQIRDMVVLQQQAARATSLAVKRFDAEVFKNQSRQQALEQQVIITQNKLNVLLGRFPQKISRPSKEFPNYVFTTLKTSVPSKLLDNRPDVRQAALELKAADLNVKVAKARFYPSLSIDGEAGYEYFNSKHFENPTTSLFYGIAAGLTAPLLNRKAIKADYFTANNKQIQAVYHYEQTLVKSYTEVSNQLISFKKLNEIYDLKVKQVKALNDSIEISNTLFRAARVDYIESLLTQRDALEAQMELVEVKKQQLAASVDLYKALGGGWKGIKEDFVSNY